MSVRVGFFIYQSDFFVFFFYFNSKPLCFQVKMNFTLTEDVIKKRIEDEQIYQQVLQVFYILFYFVCNEKGKLRCEKCSALHFLLL